MKQTMLAAHKTNASPDWGSRADDKRRWMYEMFCAWALVVLIGTEQWDPLRPQHLLHLPHLLHLQAR